MITDKEYQDRLNNFRTEIRLTAQDMSVRDKAEEIGIGFTTLYRILRGENPTLRAYLQICDWIEETNEVEAREREENAPALIIKNGTKKAKGKVR